MGKPYGNIRSFHSIKTSRSFLALSFPRGPITDEFQVPRFELQKVTASVFILATEATIHIPYTFTVSTLGRWMGYQAQGQADSSNPEAALRTSSMQSRSVCISIIVTSSRWRGTSQKD